MSQDLTCLEVEFKPDPDLNQKQNLLIHYLKMGNTRRACCCSRRASRYVL